MSGTKKFLLTFFPNFFLVRKGTEVASDSLWLVTQPPAAIQSRTWFRCFRVLIFRVVRWQSCPPSYRQLPRATLNPPTTPSNPISCLPCVTRRVIVEQLVRPQLILDNVLVVLRRQRGPLQQQMDRGGGRRRRRCCTITTITASITTSNSTIISTI